MKLTILLAGFVALTAAKPWQGHWVWRQGVVQDTPEVAAAKAAHLAAHHREALRSGLGYAGAWFGAYHDGQWRGEGLIESQDWARWNAPLWNGAVWRTWHDGQWRGEGLAESQDTSRWNTGAYAAGWAHTGVPLDTPEVAAAKASHLAAHSAVAASHAAAGIAVSGEGQWLGEGLAESLDNAGVLAKGTPADGQWRGEGLVESQDNAGISAKGTVADGEYRGEGIVESQDNVGILAKGTVEDGQYRGEGLAEAQDNAAVVAKGTVFDGQYRGEGLAEAQDNAGVLAKGTVEDGQYRGEGLAEAQDVARGLYHDGQWRGEGLAESQDYGQWNGGFAWNTVPYALPWHHTTAAAPLVVHQTPAVVAATTPHIATHHAASVRSGVGYALAWSPVGSAGYWGHASSVLAPVARVSHVATVTPITRYHTHIAPVVYKGW